jgi:hypothetical protein
MKSKNLFSFAVSIIMVLAIIMVSACGQKTTTTTPTTTTKTSVTTTATTAATTATTTQTPVITAPMVTFTINANGATNVPVNTTVGVFFTQKMDPLTLNATTFTLRQGGTPSAPGSAVAGTVTYGGAAVTFTPAAALSANTLYTATVTTGAKNLAGTALANPYVWSWTTGSASDTTAPTVTGTINNNGAVNVPLNTKASAFFSEVMDPFTITSDTFTLMQGTTPIAGAVAYLGLTATFTPTAVLTANTLYTATITTGAKDLAGNPLAANYQWSWTTGAAPDVTPPTVSSTIPVNTKGCVSKWTRQAAM